MRTRMASQTQDYTNGGAHPHDTIDRLFALNIIQTSAPQEGHTWAHTDPKSPNQFVKLKNGSSNNPL